MMRCLIGPVLCTPNTPTALRSRTRTSFPPSLLVLVLSLPSKEELRPKNHLDYRLDRRHRAGNGADATLQKLDAARQAMIAHPDALDPQKCDAIVRVMEETLAA